MTPNSRESNLTNVLEPSNCSPTYAKEHAVIIYRNYSLVVFLKIIVLVLLSSNFACDSEKQRLPRGVTDEELRSILNVSVSNAPDDLLVDTLRGENDHFQARNYTNQVVFCTLQDGVLRREITTGQESTIAFIEENRASIHWLFIGKGIKVPTEIIATLVELQGLCVRGITKEDLELLSALKNLVWFDVLIIEEEYTFPYFPKLEVLTLYGPAGHLLGESNQTQLKALTIHGRICTDSTIAKLPNSAPNLEYLGIGPAEETAVTKRSIEPLGRLSKLKFLYLGDTELTGGKPYQLLLERIPPPTEILIGF